MKPRHKNIIGSEMEWAITGRKEDSNSFMALDFQNSMPVVSPIVSSNYLYDDIAVQGGFLSNGARYYVDCGHVEYATPENLSLDDVVLSEIAGERIVAESLRRFIATHSSLAEVKLYKRVIDDDKQTWGYHMNISEDRHVFAGAPGYPDLTHALKHSLKPLIFHYATSLPMLGAGVVLKEKYGDEHRYRYSLGQKVIALTYDVVSGTTTSYKPYISSRDEPHADKEKYVRLHIVGTDPHILPWGTRMMVGTTTLMLAGIRQGKLRELEYGVSNVIMPGVNIGKKATFDIEGVEEHPFIVNGKTKNYKDTDIQEMYIEDLDKVKGKTDDEQWAYEQWQQAIEDRKQDTMRLADRSDAIAKLSLIRDLNRKRGKGEDIIDATASELDKTYTVVFRTTKENAQNKSTDELIGLTFAEKLRRKVSAENMPSEQKIGDRIINAPTSTRAHVRGEVIRNKANQHITSVAWDKYTVDLGNGSMRYVNLEPWDTVLSDIE